VFGNELIDIPENKIEFVFGNESYKMKSFKIQRSSNKNLDHDSFISINCQV